MTTESLSPASRIVIETSSRPLGERSTSISLTGAAAGGVAEADGLARGAISAAAGASLGPNDGPAAAVDSGTPSTAPWVAGRPPEAAGSGGPASALSPGWAFAEEAELAILPMEGDAAASAFRPPRPASDAADRVEAAVGFAAPPAAREATGAAALLIAAAASAAGVASASERPAPAAEGGDGAGSRAGPRPCIESGTEGDGLGAPVSLSPPGGAGANEGASVDGAPAAGEAPMTTTPEVERAR
jgi:hypothetical protein